MSKQHEQIAKKALLREVRRDGSAGDPELNEVLIRERAQTKRGELKLIRQRLASSIDGQVARAADLVLQAGDAPMGDSSYSEFRTRLNRAAEAAQIDRLLGELEDGYEARARDMRVVSEPRTYGPESPSSYFTDLGTLVAGEGDVGVFRHQAAAERLSQHSVEVSYEMRARSKEGKRAEKVLREQCRVADIEEHRRRSTEIIKVAREQRMSDIRETRALLTGGGITASASGGGAAAFVSPYFIVQDWAPFRGISRTFADQCFAWPMPEFGMNVYIPFFASTTGVSQQTEGSGVTETDPSTALQSAPVVNISGQVTLSMQLHERGFTGGGMFDKVLGRQIQQQLDEKINLYVLNQVIAGGASVAGASTWTPSTQGIAPLYTDIAKGREQLTDTAGTRLRPTHFFSTSDFYSFVTRQVDASTFRPWVVPTFAPGYPIVQGADDGPQGDKARPKWARFTGTVLPAGVLWFTDDAIPASGSDTPLIVGAPDQAVTLCESDAPVLTAFTDAAAAAGSLEVILNLRSYVASVLRHANGIATIVGNAYTTSLV